jgi:two-component system, NarL family, nitrate/nitrite response regulator NarL
MPISGMQVSTILVCNNPMLREGLKHILSDTRFRIQVENADGGEMVLSQSAEPGPTLFIVDANHEFGRPSAKIQSLKTQYPTAKIVVLANHFELNEMLAALDAGAHGYCLTTIGCDALVKSLDLVVLGEVVFPAASFLANVGSLSNRSEPVRQERSEPMRLISSDRPTRTLSSREAEILRCLMQGAPNKVIARELDVAEATVKVHVKAILRKIQVSNRTQAAIWAAENLAVSPPPEYISSAH